jgi:hypothetical protein
MEGVTLTFDHLGGAVDPMEQRFAEPGRMAAARAPGKNPWLRLTNHSTRVISFRTFSTYLKQPVEWFDLGNEHKVIALEDGMEIALPAGFESRRGSRIDLGSGGGDMYWVSFLPPGRSVVFSVPPAALKRQRRVFVEFDDAVTPGRGYRVYLE